MSSNKFSSTLCLPSDSKDFLRMMGHHVTQHGKQGPMSNRKSAVWCLRQAADKFCQTADEEQHIKKSPLSFQWVLTHTSESERSSARKQEWGEWKAMIKGTELATEFWKTPFPIWKINRSKKVMPIIKRMIRKKKMENLRKKIKRQRLGMLQWKNSSLAYMSTQTVTPSAGDRLLKVTEAGCGMKHGRQTLSAFISIVNRNEQQANIQEGGDSALTCTGGLGPLCTAASPTIPI